MRAQLTFNPTPHCCGKELGNDWPALRCAQCGNAYNADDVMEIMLEIQATGKRPRGAVSVRMLKPS